MTKDKLDLIEKLIKVHDDGVASEGGGSSCDAWGPGSFRRYKDGALYWAPGPPHLEYDDIPTQALPELLTELVAFARSKL